MFKAIEKTTFWAALDACPRLEPNRGLKHVQDITLLHHMIEREGARICEVGGGNSRVLDELCKKNECWNVDAMEGLGNGPTEISGDSRIRHVDSYFGDFDVAIPDSYFDVVFSVSVIEHIPIRAFGDFFRDCARVCRPGGTILHAIDLYLPDHDDPDPWDRSLLLINGLEDAVKSLGDLVEWLEPDCIEPPRHSSARFASNTDLRLHGWNSSVPKLKDVRARSQSCSLICGLRRTAAAYS